MYFYFFIFLTNNDFREKCIGKINYPAYDYDMYEYGNLTYNLSFLNRKKKKYIYRIYTFLLFVHYTRRFDRYRYT